MSYELKELNEEQENEVSQLNDSIVTTMVTPDGQETKVLPQFINQALKDGLVPKYSNTKFNVRQMPWTDPTEITSAELPDYIDRGYIVDNPAERYYKNREAWLEDQANQPKPLNLARTIAGISGSIARGITWGASDIAQRGAFAALEALGAVEEGTATAVADEARRAQDELGGWGTALEVAGGLGTGGLVAKAGKTMAQRLALSAAEGAVSGGLYTAGREAMNDENVTAETYLWSAGIGGAMGFLGQGIAEGLGKVREFSRIQERELPILTNDRNIVDNFKATPQGVENTTTIPFFNDKGEPIAFAKLSQNVSDSYNTIGKTGVNLEELSFVDGITKEQRTLAQGSIVNSLIEDFGTIASPTKIEALNDVKDIFRTYGVGRKTMDGEPFFLISEEVLPMKKPMLLLTYTKKLLEKTGNVPEKGTKQRELFDKLFDDRTGLYTKDFLDYHNSWEPYLDKATKNVIDVVDSAKKNTAAANTFRQEVLNSIPKAKEIALKEKVTDLSYKIDDRIEDILSYNSTDLDNVANTLRKHNNTLKSILDNDDVISAYKNFYNAKQDIFNLIQGVTKKGEAGKYFNAESKKALKGLLEEFNSVLRSPDLIGQDLAESFYKLDLYATRMIKANEVFNKVMKVDSPTQFQRAVKQAFRPREGGVAGAQNAVDNMLASSKAFTDVLEELKGKGFIKGVEIADKKQTMKALSEIGKLREFQELSFIVNKAKSRNALGGMLSAGGASLGSVGGSTIAGGIIGGPIGGAIGALVGASGVSKIMDPEFVLKLASDRSNAFEGVFNTVNKVVDKDLKYNLPQRRAIAGAIGINSNRMRSNKDYVESIREKMQAIKSQTELIYGEIGDALIEDAIKKQSDKVVDYVLEKLPNTPKGINVSIAEGAKVDKLMFAALQPQKALEHALYAGDTDVLEHLRAMYPLVMDHAQLVSQAVEPTGNPVRDRRLSTVKGVGTVRKSAFKNAQSTFLTSEQKTKGGGISIPNMPVGSEIQNR